jgi:hypothetical protein
MDLTDSDKARILEWLVSYATGTVKVMSDGSREPQIEWTISSFELPRLYGKSPLEALQNAWEAKQQSSAN